MQVHWFWMSFYFALFINFSLLSQGSLYTCDLSCSRISIPSQLLFLPKILLHIGTTSVHILSIVWDLFVRLIKQYISFSFSGQLKDGSQFWSFFILEKRLEYNLYALALAPFTHACNLLGYLVIICFILCWFCFSWNNSWVSVITLKERDRIYGALLWLCVVW